MRHLTLFVCLVAVFALPLMVTAQGLALGPNAGPFQDLLLNILMFINRVLIPFIMGIGFLVFVWGMFQFFIAGGSNDESKEKGKSLMVYATLGFVLIIVFWGVINLLARSTGLQSQSIAPLIPGVPGGGSGIGIIF